jgi:hypothetical protein
MLYSTEEAGHESSCSHTPGKEAGKELINFVVDIKLTTRENLAVRGVAGF